MLVACSAGADSLALLAATVFEARRTKWRVVGVTIDHGLQDGSADRAVAVVRQMADLGAHETAAVRVSVEPGGRGLEPAAREARYAALERLAQRSGSEVVLLGHTLDDQAETVLLGLTRGSGGRSIAGMRPAFAGPGGSSPSRPAGVGLRRPLLHLSRAQTEAACAAEGVDFWSDPHNADPRFTRARIRHRVLPVLEEELGPGVAAALSRTAGLLQWDMDALDSYAEQEHEQARTATGLGVAALEGQPTAVRLRVLRLAALRAGCPGGELFRTHVLAVDELVSSWHGQRRTELPGHVRVVREAGELRFRRTGEPQGPAPVAG